MEQLKGPQAEVTSGKLKSQVKRERDSILKTKRKLHPFQGPALNRPFQQNGRGEPSPETGGNPGPTRDSLGKKRPEKTREYILR